MTGLYGGGERPEHSPIRSGVMLPMKLYGGGERPEHSPSVHAFPSDGGCTAGANALSTHPQPPIVLILLCCTAGANALSTHLFVLEPGHNISCTAGANALSTHLQR